MRKCELSDGQLVTLYQNGNEEAFAELVERHRSRAYTTIFLIVKDTYVAEDLLQETFIKAVDTIKSNRYNEEGKFLPWLVRIAHNLAIDSYRRAKRHPMVVTSDGFSVFDTMEFAEESFEAAQIKEETYAHLRTMINKLPEPQREVLLMRHYGDMSFQEIAESTGVCINTALGRMRYALINLRKYMKTNNDRTYDPNHYPK